MTVLILSHHGDLHADVVAWALNHVGIRARILTLSDVPTYATAAASFDYRGWKLVTDMVSKEAMDSVQIVWNRRRGRFSPDQRRDPPENRYIEYETRQWLIGVHLLIEQDVLAINPTRFSMVSENKLTQLRVAQQCGLRIPLTIAGNSLHAARKLLGGRPVAFKCFRVPVWTGSDIVSTDPAGLRATVCMTSLIDSLDSIDEFTVAASPAIYQEYVEKSFEVRVFRAGRHYAAVKISSQAKESTRIDWRADQNKLIMEPYELPVRIADRLGTVFEKLGIEVGAVDLIVDKDGDFVFLEVNPSGQFLWMDDCSDTFDSVAVIVAHIADLAQINVNLPQDKPLYKAFLESGGLAEWRSNVDGSRIAMHTDYSYR